MKNKRNPRESLQQLSNASSPAESVVSTSSNPGHSHGWGAGGSIWDGFKMLS